MQPRKSYSLSGITTEHCRSQKRVHSYEVLYLIMGLVKCKCGAENIEFFEIGVVLALVN